MLSSTFWILCDAFFKKSLNKKKKKQPSKIRILSVIKESGIPLFIQPQNGPETARSSNICSSTLTAEKSKQTTSPHAKAPGREYPKSTGAQNMRMKWEIETLRCRRRGLAPPRHQHEFQTRVAQAQLAKQTQLEVQTSAWQQAHTSNHHAQGNAAGHNKY